MGTAAHTANLNYYLALIDKNLAEIQLARNNIKVIMLELEKKNGSSNK